ncbi:glycosyltransferase [Candidatus Harpocratesius sp.]
MGLRKLGHEIIICRYEFKTKITNPLLFFWETIKEYKFLLCNLVKIRFDYLVVGYPILKPVWLTRLIPQRKVILDPFISNFNTVIFDHKIFKPDSFIAKLLYIYEKKALSKSQYILTDTKAHMIYFSTFFQIPLKKFRVIPVGSNNKVYYPEKNKILNKDQKFIVGFYGKFIPLQGIETIIKAAELLKENDQILFEIIGGLPENKIYLSMQKYIKEKNLTNVKLIPRVSEQELRRYIQRSTIQLGIFGDSLKAKIVIPNKVFSALAIGKPVITSRNYATREFFTPDFDLILCNSHDPTDLAYHIIDLFKNPEKVKKIGENAYKKYLSAFTPEKIGKYFENHFFRNENRQ